MTWRVGRLANLAVHLLAFLAVLAMTTPYLFGAWFNRQAGAALHSAMAPPQIPLMPIITPIPSDANEQYLDKAVSLSEQALRWNPFSSQAHKNLIRAYLLAEKYAQAVAQLEQLGRFPSYGAIASAERMMLHANASLLADSPQQVAQDWQRMGVDAWTFTQAGDVYWNAYADPEAELLYQSALLLAPDSSDIWAAWGKYHLRNRNEQQAVEAYERAVQLDTFQRTGRSSAYYYLGRFDYIHGMDEQALARLKIAVAEDDFDNLIEKASAYTRLGIIYQKMGNQEEAKRMFELAAQYTPPRPSGKTREQ